MHWLDNLRKKVAPKGKYLEYTEKQRERKIYIYIHTCTHMQEGNKGAKDERK